MKINIVEPAPADNHWFHLPIRSPHLGPPILAGLLRAKGHQASVFSEMVGPIDLDQVMRADVVGISVNTTLTHQRAYELASEVRRRAPNAILVAGGHHATMNDVDALRHVDYVARGYAEDSFPSLLDEFARGVRRPLTPGVSYRDPDDGHVVRGDVVQASTVAALPDLQSIVGFREAMERNYWNVDRYARWLPLSYFSRGCAFSCTFCTIPLTDGTRMAYRSSAAVLEDLGAQMSFYQFPYRKPRFWLIDDNFGQERASTKQFLRDVIAANLGCRFVVQARVEIARDPELLELMKRARFSQIYLGVESVSAESLTSMNKRSSLEKIEVAVSAIRAHGIRVVALLMLGNDGDRPGIADQTLAFLRRLKVAQINPQITVPYPGTPFFDLVADEGRLFTSDYRYCNRSLIHFPRHIRPSRVLRELAALMQGFYGWRNLTRSAFMSGNIQRLVARAGAMNSGFLGRSLAGVGALEKIESDFYDSDDHLREGELHRAWTSGALAERVVAVGGIPAQRRVGAEPPLVQLGPRPRVG